MLKIYILWIQIKYLKIIDDRIVVFSLKRISSELDFKFS